MSLVNLPEWKEISSYLHVVDCPHDGGDADGRIRIEFLHLPARRMRELVKITMPCVACQRPIFPLRLRKGDAWDGGRLYYACACPIGVSIACSRGRAAELEYERFKGIVAGMPAKPNPQLGLFG